MMLLVIELKFIASLLYTNSQGQSAQKHASVVCVRLNNLMRAVATRYLLNWLLGILLVSSSRGNFMETIRFPDDI